MKNIPWGKIVGKKKRILLSILMCGCFSSTAYADYTYTWDDYTDKVILTDKTYTYTDAGGQTDEITYKTAEAEDPGIGSITVKTDLGDGDSGDFKYTSSAAVNIDGTDVDFNVYYKGSGTEYDTGIINDDGSYSSASDPKDITGDFVGIATDEAGAIYNTGSSSVIGNITGGFINNGGSAAGYDYGGAIYNGTDAVINSITDSYFIGNSIKYGGAIYNGTDAVINSISGSYFIGNTSSSYGAVIYNLGTISSTENYFIGNTSSGSSARGGVLYNYDDATFSSTSDYFIGNTASAGSTGNGGAVYNYTGTFSSSSSYFIGNTSTSSAGAIYSYRYGVLNIEDSYFIANEASGSTGQGGVIYNYNNGTLTVKDSYFINNAASGSSGRGGAIYNQDSTMDDSGSYYEGNSAYAGGAIYNYSSTLSISGDYFVGNTASNSGGGAIYSYSGAILSSDGSYFVGNTARQGGAIYNYSSILSSRGDYFVGNTASGPSARGGAIYNEKSETSSITGSYFAGNSAISTGEALGGAIYNIGIIDNFELGWLSGNYAEGATGAEGGAIYDTTGEKITVNGYVAVNYAKAETGDAYGGAVYLEAKNGEVSIAGNLFGNHVEAESGNAYGGAIYNTGTATITGSAIAGNYASGDMALGGAIYNAGTVNINAVSDMTISGNYTESGGTKEENFLYGTADSVTNFNMADASITLLDSLSGDDGYEVNITGNGTDATTFYFLNDMEKANLSLSSTTVNTINNEIHSYNVNKLTINGDTNMVADVDLANETMDSFTASEYGSHKGKLNISGVNLLSDTEKDSVEISFAEEGLKDYVTSSVGTLPDSTNQQKAYTPLYQYNVAYDNRSDGGYFTFDKAGNNPSADVPEEGEAAAISFMNLMYRYAFEHSDYYMKLPKKVRQAIRDGAGEDGEKDFKNYNGHNLTEPGIWVKPFASNETIPFKTQFTARTRNYGLLVGMDTSFKEKGNWANVFTGYVGYDGIHQSFEGNSVKQYGGVIGVTDTVYKGNFYAALTLSGGENVLKAHTMYGSEKTHLYMYGVAAKTGYNMEFAGGKYSFLPTFMASYTYADVRDYTSASGLRMDADGMHAVELNPNFKFIRNFNNGWQPYLTVGEIWTVGQNSNIKAGGTKLDELTFKPYTEYGLGLQKMWSKGYDGYAEFLGHAGGRRGFLVNLGFRWAFN